MAQRDRLNLFAAWAWGRSSNMGRSAVGSAAIRYASHLALQRPDLRALAWEPDVHAVAQELHTSANHHVSNLQSADDLYAVLADAGDINRGLAHDVAHRVDEERHCSAIAFSQRRQGYDHGRGVLLDGERDRCGHAEAHGLRWLFHCNANRISSRGWIGLAGNLANPPLDADARWARPKRSPGQLSQCETCRILLGDGDGDFGFPGLRQ